MEQFRIAYISNQAAGQEEVDPPEDAMKPFETLGAKRQIRKNLGQLPSYGRVNFKKRFRRGNPQAFQGKAGQ